MKTKPIIALRFILHFRQTNFPSTTITVEAHLLSYSTLTFLGDKPQLQKIKFNEINITLTHVLPKLLIRLP